MFLISIMDKFSTKSSYIIPRMTSAQLRALGQAGASMATGIALERARDYAVDYFVGQATEASANLYKKYKSKSSGKKLRGYTPKNKILSKSIMPGKTRFPRKVYSKTSGKKSYPSKKKRTKKTSLTKQVKEIKKSIKADQARHTYKATYKNRIIANPGGCEHESVNVGGVSRLEEYIANLRYYDPSNPGTLVTASGATGTFSRNIHFKNINSRLEVRNNFLVPCKVKVYLVMPKSDTTIAPLTYYNNGIDDQVISTADETTPLLHLTDITMFNQQYKAKLVKSKYLLAGQEFSVSHNTGAFNYDPALTDSHTLEYQPKFKTAVWTIRVEPVLHHDTIVSTEIGLGYGAVDTVAFVKAEILYDAGTPLDDIYLSEGRTTTFTNAGVTSVSSIPDNITLAQA